MSDHWSWLPGMQVVCIDDDFGWIRCQGHELPHRQPMLNEVLTIASIGPPEPGALTGDANKIYLSFVEIPLRQSDGPFGASFRWAATSFRRLETKATNISVFKAMLNPSRVTEPA